MRLWRAALGSILFLAVLATTARAMVAWTTLPRLAFGSDVVVVGRVVTVEKEGEGENEIRVAEVEVLDLIKGPPGLTKVRYHAEGTWTCDTSTAYLDEKALFFFEKWAGDDHILQDSWSGHGRMPVSVFHGREYVEVDSDIVRLPLDLPSIPGDNPRYAYCHRLVPLDVIVPDLRRRLTAKPPAVPEREKEVVRLMQKYHCTMDPEEYLFDEVTEELKKQHGLAVPVLLRILEDTKSPWREAAAEAFTRLEEHGLAALNAALSSEDPARRRAAAWAFDWLGSSAQMYFEGEIWGTIFENLKTPDSRMRAHLIGALRPTVDNEEGEFVLQALHDDSPVVRLRAAEVLFVEHHSLILLDEYPAFATAEKALLAMAKGEDVAGRRAAFELLPYFATAAAEEIAEAAVRDKDPVVRTLAPLSLGRIGTPKAHAMLAIVLLESKDPWARRAAAHACEIGKVAEAVGALIQALEDSDEEVAYLATLALGAIGPKASAAIPALEKREGWDAREALEKIRGK